MAKKFWPLFWTQFLGALNDNVLKTAMVTLVEYRELSLRGFDSRSIVALSGGIFILPFFLFSMVAGEIGDKFEKSRLVRIVKIWELLITLVATLGFCFHSVELLTGALFMMGTHSAFFGPLKYSAIPELVGPGELVDANSYVEMGTFVAILLGTIAGGELMAGAHGEIVTSLAVNLFAVMGLVTSLKLVRMPSAQSHIRLSWSPIAPLRATLKILRDKPEMFSSIFAISWFWFFGAAALAVLPPYCKEYLRVSEHVMVAFLAMYTFGIGLGAFLCARLSRGRAELGLVPVAAAGLTIFLLDLCFVHPEFPAGGGALMSLGDFLRSGHGPRLLFDFMAMAVSGGVFILPLYSLLQERCDRGFLSRVIAGNNVFNAVFMVVSAGAVFALHMLGISLPGTYGALALGNLIFCVCIFLAVPEFFRRSKALYGERFG